MSEYAKTAQSIPWGSFGRDTVASKVGQSLLSVGVLPYEAPKEDPDGPLLAISSDDPEFPNYLMNIVGTAIQVGEGKLVTCAHVIEGVLETKQKGYVLSRATKGNEVRYVKHPFVQPLRYLDPRSMAGNPDVDLAAILLPAISTPTHPYDVPPIQWGDSSQLGVGDPVVVGGYPYGTDLFVNRASNKGIIQPSFYTGIVSAILPALRTNETRIIQINVAVAGGMSGGAVFDPQTGRVLGMVTSGLEGAAGDPHPVTFAIPSEVIAPFAKIISYDAGGRRWGKE